MPASGQHPRARLGEVHALGLLADEELNPEPLLELGDRERHGGLGGAAARRASRQGAGVGGGDEALQLSQGQIYVTGAGVTAVDRERWRVLLADGTWLSYDHLVLATGTRARELPLVPAGADGVISLRSVDDAGQLATSLEAAATGGRSVVCLGASFIGLEVAAAACRRGLRPTVLEMAPRVLARSASAALGEHLRRTHRERRVDLRVGVLVARVRRRTAPGRPGGEERVGPR